MGSALETLWIFTRLGLTSFGGPLAHIGYFREEFVRRRAWLTEAAFADLVGLAQVLPGPASSQVGFAIGLRRAGPWGGVAAFVGFTAPSAALMIAAAYGFAQSDAVTARVLAHGLGLVAAAIVVQALFGMARSLLAGPGSYALATAAGFAVLGLPSLFTAPAALILAGLAGAWSAGVGRRAGGTAQAPTGGRTPWPLWPLWGCAGVAAGLVLLPLAAPLSPLAAMADSAYRAGALVFGGGHVVLPLLEAEAEARGWLTSPQVLAGYGAAQALPGPLFSFAAFLGAAALGPWGALVALIFVFAPGLALMACALPLWSRAREAPAFAGFVRAANAAVVGVLAAALIDPVLITAIRSWPDALLAAGGATALIAARVPPWLIVLILPAASAALALAFPSL